MFYLVVDGAEAFVDREEVITKLKDALDPQAAVDTWGMSSRARAGMDALRSING